MQAYIGIHQPSNFKEADLARKRIIFDEFFYLQVILYHLNFTISFIIIIFVFDMV